MTDVQQRAAAKEFAAYWKNRGDEKQETQRFWIDLLRNVYGVPNPEQSIEFEVPVKLSHTSFIDAYLSDTRVLIEQKGADIDLKKGYKQSDGQVLTPFLQARRYAGYLPFNKTPRWIVVCNFQTFEIHDMNFPNGEPEVLALADLEKDYSRLQFLVDTGSKTIKKEMEISLQAGELVGVLYDALLKQYKDPTSPETLKSLNALCVRLVFCLYAEDAGIFGRRNMFHDYLKDVPATGVRKALVELFRVLDQTEEERDKYLSDDNPVLAAFPYVNGGLFADENIEIPPFTEELKNILLSNASEDFDWSAISPTIFGAVFESTLNPETRRSGGMHYTSIENIHKVIDPLFLDGLKNELDGIKEIAIEKNRAAKLAAFQDKLANLTFLDPACGSGNFLTESYISLRRLENQVIEERIILDKGKYGKQLAGQVALGEGNLNPIKVSIHQFYGIEINDFAATVAKTALWIAESQMMKETEDIIAHQIDFLPLKSYANITEGNALRLNWEDVVPKEKLNYIMGNPPFVGQSLRTKEQAEDMVLTWGKGSVETKLDYVICWYRKAIDYLNGIQKAIEVAFVSTNSICQGECVPTMWKYMINQGVEIQFAYRTFVWESEAAQRAAVHCVIVGFSNMAISKPKLLFSNNGHIKQTAHINPYLQDAPDIWIENRSNRPPIGMSKMTTGSPPTDDGALTLTADEKETLVQKYPQLSNVIRPFIGAREFLHDKVGQHSRYCLWFKNANAALYRNIPEIRDRLERVVRLRLSSNADRIKKMADYPYLFCQIRQPEDNYLVFPRHSSEKRRYIPIGFVEPNVIAGDACSIIPNATLYQFAILMSNVHNSWMRTVCGRLKSDYRYSPSVYNNFPWPTPTDAQKAKIEQTAQAILDARNLYPNCSLADLYDEATMPPELRKAHQQNDKAVMQAYGFWGKLNTESACVAELMKMYQKLTEENT